MGFLSSPLLFVTQTYKSSANVAVIYWCTYPFHHQQLTQHLDNPRFQTLTLFIWMIAPSSHNHVCLYVAIAWFPSSFMFLLLSEAIFRMPGVCPRCDKNVYFAEEVFLDLINMEILFHIYCHSRWRGWESPSTRCASSVLAAGRQSKYSSSKSSQQIFRHLCKKGENTSPV